MDRGSDDASRFGARIDQLLTSALKEQEREQAGFMKVLQASREALNATRMELDHLRSLVEERDEALLAEFDARLDRVANQDAVEALAAGSTAAARELAGLRKILGSKLDDVVESLDTVEARTSEALATLGERVEGLEQGLGDTVLAVSGELAAAGRRDEMLAATLEERLDLVERTLQERLDTVDQSLDERLATVEQTLEERLATVEQTLDERLSAVEQSVEDRLTTVEQTLDARQQEVADAILKALDPVGRIMQLVQGRLARAASDLAVAQGSLLSRLIERDDRLESERDRVLAELLNEFANGLKNRDRSRIGAQLLDAEEERKRRRDLGRSRPPAAPSVDYAPPGRLPLPPTPRVSPVSPPAADVDSPSDIPWGATFGRDAEPADHHEEDPHAHAERYAGSTRLPDEWSARNSARNRAGGVAQRPKAAAQGGSAKPRRGRKPAL